MSNSKQDNLDNIEIVLNELWNDLRETFTEIVERTILHREIHLDIVKDKLQESYDKIPQELKDKIPPYEEQS